MCVTIVIVLAIEYLHKESQVKLKVSMESFFFKEAEFIQRKDGQLKMKVSSEEVFISEDGKSMSLHQLTMFFPEKDFTIKAKKGVYCPDLGDLFLSEGIEGFSKDFRIYGVEAYWSGKHKTLYSEKPLKIEGGRFSIEGGSGKATADLIELKKGVKAVVYSEE